MFVTRVKLATAVLLGVAVGAVGQPGRPPDRREAPEVRGVVRAVDAAKRTITVAVASRGREAPEEKTFTLAKDADVLVDDGRGSRFAVKEGKLADVHPGALVTLTLTGDGKVVEGLVAEGPALQGTVKAVDVAK